MSVMYDFIKLTIEDYALMLNGLPQEANGNLTILTIQI